MKISDRLRTLFTAELDENRDSHVVEVPKDEVDLGSLQAGDVYRVAVLPQESAGSNDGTTQLPDGRRQPVPEDKYTDPPVDVGDRRVVEIESIGEQGDGIAKVDRGYVVVVPGAKQGEEVQIELNTVRENVGFADIVKRLD